ncbi:GNAT family N-acetyltransferase [Simplicispira lacusdiani]|uniref:GNAT family N-acetyltransferase n=1 Tax=Simplicispira lacusdiani TaxID=2213010 RepID=UPI000E73B945|nr:GNAT family N-acetyltransferase [Simplicispira lacusdiani]
MAENTIITRVSTSLQEVDAAAWNGLLARQAHPTPFMRHEYLAALEASGSATPDTGWTARFITLWDGATLVAACPLYLKSHSYGEYVFDWAWANAHAEHGLPYYPKALVAVPFTPVPGTRLMARDAQARGALVRALRQWCEEAGVSSLHLLFAVDEDLDACAQAGLMQRQTVQFHWKNAAPGSDSGYRGFDGFLEHLNQEKRKKIRQERRRVAEAGVTFRWLRGTDIGPGEWDFFYRCYAHTYWEHGNPPYLTRDFFTRMAAHMPEAWVLFIAEREGRPIASSLIAIDAYPSGDRGTKDTESVAYGRYWGALERVDCLHFEACYYQPLQWCIEHGVRRFEGGAQGEHKMARALLPVPTRSAHWLAHPAFADAVDRYLQRETQGMAQYLEHLRAHSPLRRPAGP